MKTCCCQRRALVNGASFSNSCAGVTKTGEHCGDLCRRCVAVQLSWAAHLLEREPEAELGVISGDRLRPEHRGRPSAGERNVNAAFLLGAGPRPDDPVDDPTFRTDPVVPVQQRKRRRRRRAAERHTGGGPVR